MIADAAWPDLRSGAAGRRPGHHRGPGQRQAARYADRAARARPRGSRSARARIRQGPAPARRRSAAQGHCRSRPAGEYRRMMRRARLAACCLLALCRAAGFSRSTAAAAAVRWRQPCARSQVAPIAGQSGWLMRNKLIDRLGEAGQRRRALPARRRRSTTISPRSASAATARRRRSGGRLRARYQLVELANGTVVLDATAGSDAGIDIVSSEYATVAAEQTALENLVRHRRRPDRRARWRSTRRGRSRGEVKASKASRSPARSTSPTAGSASICFMAPTKRSRGRWRARLVEALGREQVRDRRRRHQVGSGVAGRRSRAR